MPFMNALPPRHSAQSEHLGQTPSQTVGPFFGFGLAPVQYGYEFGQPLDCVIARPHADGEHIRLSGRVLDGAGVPVTDALVEVLQADAQGRVVNSPQEAEALGFRGFGRCGTGTEADARFCFHTVKPGSLGGQAPHLSVVVLMRGMLQHAFTRMYFEGEASNAVDEVLGDVPAERRHTLLASRAVRGGIVEYTWDIRMQGVGATVFFDV